MPKTTESSPGPVPVEALNYFRAKKLKPSFSYLDIWKEEHAISFTVAKAMQVDILQDIRNSVDEALAHGKTFREFQKELIPTLQKKGWWGRKEMVDPLTGKAREVQLGSPRRLRTIYNANMRTARAAGQWDRIQRTKKTHPYLIYSLGPSEHHRPQHVSWSGLTLPADDPFWDTHFPPNGWGCKCSVRQVSKREVEKLGGVSKLPKVEYQSWMNKRSGHVLRVPRGIDPGWDTNPGKNRLPKSKKLLAEKTEQFKDSTKPVPKRKSPVSKALDVVPKRGKVKKAVDEALKAIDSVHDDGELPVIPVKSTQSKKFLGCYKYNGLNGKPIEVLISSTDNFKSFTATHEFGHFIDHQALGIKGKYASIDYPLLDGFREAVRNSNAYKKLLSAKAISYRARDVAFYEYLLRKQELWARAYSQYIAQKTNDSLLLEGLQDMRTFEENLQWDSDDFIEIEKAIDDLFKNKGWL